jgi:elongation factor 1-beta
MADVVVTLRVMPESPEVDLEKLKAESLEKVSAFSGNANTKVELVPVAFGLKALQIMFVMAEDKGSTDKLEEDIGTLEGVTSVEVTDVRRTIG